MTMLRLLPLLLLAVPAAPLLAQDSGYAYPLSGYDTDGQSVEAVDVFVEPLSHYGRWLDTRYGRVWSPGVARDWRPYTIGHWEAGRFGQTWRSDEPFGWAVFHFGRWTFDAQLGWLWSPDTLWGPGWVAWRDGDDVTGWAPLPPQISVGFAFGSGFGFNDWGYDQWYQPAWVYVPRGYLYSRSLRGVYLPFARNRDLWERTHGVVRYDRRDDLGGDRGFGDRGRDFRRDDRRDGVRGDARDRARDEVRDRSRDGGRDGVRPDARVGDRRDEARGMQTYPAVQGRAAVPQAIPAVPAEGGRPRGFGGRDGYVPGAVPRTFDRRPVPQTPPPAFRAAPATIAPAPLAVRPPPMYAAPLAPRPAPEPRPVPRAPQPRERNPDERPR